ncbi:ABC transporter ATP-binding protein [Paenibacillus psychroresistens]|uniref:ABC transporter ATP-binding protein n=1 Tax=Paenibacillus psychroresistens TaxID=1778678 RepID=A0A6B8RSQ3_9BACL|nr:ABC transporter ATP-binding protein [Paenibacillus psychroresistens]QGQ98844.1 ABC transporter ATP-binding protein [Paenibacillus psychroresistens]
MTSILSLSQVTKRIEDKFTLGPLDLEIEPGVIVALVGPNGSGKTTLFRMLMNMVQSDSGELKLFHKQYPADEVSIKQKVGYVSETSVIHEMFKTVSDALKFAAYWYPTWDVTYSELLLEKFEITRTDKLNGLSKGTRRKLDLILALAHHPDLLLLDEPSSGLDPFAWRLMMEEMAHYMEAGHRTVFMATHIMDEVRRLADYVVFLYHGKLLGFYEKDALLDGWKTIWVDRLPAASANIKGIVAVEQDSSIKLISDSAQETLHSLKANDINVIKTQSVDLDEIFMHLLHKNNLGSKREGKSG